MCDACREGIEAVEKKEAQAMKDIGWYAHYVTDDPGTPFQFNYHTHGFPQKFGHPDIQVCFPVPFDIAHRIAWSAAHHLEEGGKLEAGKSSDAILEGYEVMCIKAHESGRDVIRLVLPDKNGRFEGEFFKQMLFTDNQILN